MRHSICSRFTKPGSCIHSVTLAVFLAGCVGGHSGVSETGTGVDTSGAATIRWNPVTRNIDGTEASDIAGYNIYYGTTEGQYPNKVTVPDPEATSFVIKDLSAATYYFVITVYDHNGNESGYSSVARKTVD